MAYEVHHHPYFMKQLEGLIDIANASDEARELLADISQLIEALENNGKGIEGHEHGDPSHPIIASNFMTFALRRTPPTYFTPLANDPPVLRIPYVWFADIHTGKDLAVMMLIGDKTNLGNEWYQPIVKRIETLLIPDWIKHNPHHKPKRKYN